MKMPLQKLGERIFAIYNKEKLRSLKYKECLQINESNNMTEKLAKHIYRQFPEGKKNMLIERFF